MAEVGRAGDPLEGGGGGGSASGPPDAGPPRGFWQNLACEMAAKNKDLRRELAAREVAVQALAKVDNVLTRHMELLQQHHYNLAHASGIPHTVVKKDQAQNDSGDPTGWSDNSVEYNIHPSGLLLNSKEELATALETIAEVLRPKPRPEEMDDQDQLDPAPFFPQGEGSMGQHRPTKPGASRFESGSSYMPGNSSRPPEESPFGNRDGMDLLMNAHHETAFYSHAVQHPIGGKGASSARSELSSGSQSAIASSSQGFPQSTGEFPSVMQVPEAPPMPRFHSNTMDAPSYDALQFSL